ncbi:fused MFS/spermidine synthase [Fibrobacterota bacterium]
MHRKNDHLLLIAFVLSGFSALGYEILWTKLLGLSLGSETVAVYGVLAGYFGGMSLGAYLFSRRIRFAELPALWYVCFEVILAVYACIMPFIFLKLPAFLPLLLANIVGQNNSVTGLFISFLVAGILFLPATVCLGATLPALVEARKRSLSEDNTGRGMGRLYGANTAGATIGIFAAVFFILPNFGMLWGSFLLALCSFGAAGCASIWNKNYAVKEVHTNRDRKKPDKKGSEVVALLILLFLTGFAGIGFEVVGMQILSQVFRNTIYTFANILGVFLVGTAAGAWLYSVIIKRTSLSFSTILGILLAGLSFSITLAAFPMAKSLSLLHTIAPLAGSSFLRHLIGELMVSCMIFFVPALFMGALFSHIVSQFTDAGVGRAVALNTLGATLAPVLFALIFIEGLGYTGSFYLIVIVYFVLFALAALFWKINILVTAIGFIFVIVTGIAAPKDCVILNIRSGQRVVKRYEGIMGQVMVLEDTDIIRKMRKRYLQVDRYYSMGGGEVIKEKRQALMPLLLTSGKGRILYLGVGTGVFANAARSFDFDTIDAVEIVPEILEALDYFAVMNDSISKAGNVHFYSSDARRFVFATKNSYDVIFGDLFHPSRPGASFLLTVEHFKAIKSRLKEDGVFIQFIPLYQYDVKTLKTILRTFQAAFPFCHAMLGRVEVRNVMILIGYNNDQSDIRINLSDLQTRIDSTYVVRTLVHNPVSLFAHYLLDSKGIAGFAGKGPLNKDLHPKVMFDVPKLAYESVPAERMASLSAVLDNKKNPPEKMIFDTSQIKIKQFRDKSGKFGKALACFIKAEVISGTVFSLNDRPEEAIELYVQSYEANPVFALNQGIPFMLSPNLEKYYKKIFPRLIAVTPHFRWLYIDYLNYLQNEAKDMEQYEKIFNLAIPVFGGEDSLSSVLRSSSTFKKD